MATIKCTEKGSHTNDEREKIMLAIQYAIVHKIKGIYLSATIKERLAEKGFSKIILWEGYKAISMTRIDFSAYKYSVWTVDGCDGELYIYTDVVVK